jgi:hypothetical protein
MRRMNSRQPDPDARKSPPVPGEKKKPGRTQPGEQQTSEKPDGEISQAENEPSGEFRREVTNTDEQSKVTNGQNSGNPLDEKEREGV